MSDLRCTSSWIALCVLLVVGLSSRIESANGKDTIANIDAVNRSSGGNGASSIESEEEREIKKNLDKVNASPQERRRLIVVVQMLLGRFGYGIGPFDGRFDDKTRRAVKYYQETNKLPATGELDYQTLKRLTDDSSAIEARPVLLPSYTFIVEKWDEQVLAGGTWVSQKEHQEAALETTTIRCHRKGKRCTESTAVVDENNHLRLSVEEHEVERWDDQDIVTHVSKGPCGEVRLRISRSQKTAIREQAKTASEGCPTGQIGQATFRLEDGSKVWRDVNQSSKEKIRRILKTGDFNYEDTK